MDSLLVPHSKSHPLTSSHSVGTPVTGGLPFERVFVDTGGVSLSLGAAIQSSRPDSDITVDVEDEDATPRFCRSWRRLSGGSWVPLA